MNEILSLHVYPIKSCRGIRLEEALLFSTGIRYDREWMLIDEQNDFISQRDYPRMALFQCSFTDDTLRVIYKSEVVDIPLSYDENSSVINAKVWGRKSPAYEVSSEISAWFTDKLDKPVRLVRKVQEEVIPVNKHAEVEINFPDGHQYLVIGTASLEALNGKLKEAVNMDRFRPNIVISTDKPFLEDNASGFRLSDVVFMATKPCSRCKIVNIDQSTSIVRKEPLLALSKFRKENGKVLFGHYYKSRIPRKTSLSIKVGEQLDWL